MISLRRFSLTVVGETLARRLLQNSSLATPPGVMPTTACASTQPTLSHPHSSSAPKGRGSRPSGSSSTPKGKGSARGRNVRKRGSRPATSDHTSPDLATSHHTPLSISSSDHTPLSISSSPECIPIASPANQVSYGRFVRGEEGTARYTIMYQ